MQKQSTVKTISSEELARLLDYLGKDKRAPKGNRQRLRNKCAVVFLVNTGLRIGEFCQLKVGDLTFDKKPVRSLIIRPEIAKNKKERTIPLNLQAGGVVDSMNRFIWIPEHRHPELYAWQLADTTKPVSARLLQTILSNAGKRVLGRNITPHMLRHTFATRAIRSSNTRVVQKLLGHTNLQTTQIYTHPDDVDLKNAVDLI